MNDDNDQQHVYPLPIQDRWPTEEFRKNFLSFSLKQEYSLGLRILSGFNILWSGFWILILGLGAMLNVASGEEPIGMMIFVVFFGWSLFVAPLWFIVHIWQSKVKERQLFLMMEDIKAEEYTSSDGWTSGSVEPEYPGIHTTEWSEVPEGHTIEMTHEEISAPGEGGVIKEEGGEITEEIRNFMVNRAKELEEERRYDEAIVLYEQCEMWDDVDRMVMKDIEGSEN